MKFTKKVYPKTEHKVKAASGIFKNIVKMDNICLMFLFVCAEGRKQKVFLQHIWQQADFICEYTKRFAEKFLSNCIKKS